MESPNGYGLIVCTKEHAQALDFATKEVADLAAVHEAIAEAVQITPDWKFVMVVPIEEMPGLMEGFVPGWVEGKEPDGNPD